MDNHIVDEKCFFDCDMLYQTWCSIYIHYECQRKAISLFIWSC